MRLVLGLLISVSFAIVAPFGESQETSPSPVEVARRRLVYCGPGDGEPTALFRLIGQGLGGSEISVHLQDRYIFSLPLPQPEAPTETTVHGESGGEGVDGQRIDLEITNSDVERVTRRGLSDFDLPPVTVTVLIHNRLTMGVDIVTWKGYLQGCWLQFPRSSDGSAEQSPETEPFLKPKVDISHTFGEPMPIDIRLERTTIYYMLFASEDRDAVLLHPENPETYSRAGVVAAGTFAWDPEQGASKNLRRLKYTPTCDKVYLTLWALHRAAAEGTEAPDGPVRVNGWSRSAVYELTNGLLEEGGLSSEEP